MCGCLDSPFSFSASPSARLGSCWTLNPSPVPFGRLPWCGEQGAVRELRAFPADSLLLLVRGSDCAPCFPLLPILPLRCCLPMPPWSSEGQNQRPWPQQSCLLQSELATSSPPASGYFYTGAWSFQSPTSTVLRASPSTLGSTQRTKVLPSSRARSQSLLTQHRILPFPPRWDPRRKKANPMAPHPGTGPINISTSRHASTTRSRSTYGPSMLPRRG